MPDLLWRFDSSLAFSVARLSPVRCGVQGFSTRTVLVGPMLSLLAGEMPAEELLISSCLRMLSHLTYLIISVLNSLVARGYTPHVAWRISFVMVPFIIVMFIAMMILFFAPDTPTGKWEDRHLNNAAAVTKTEAVAVVNVEKYGMEDANQTGQQSDEHSAELEKGDPAAHGAHGHKRRDSAVVDSEDVQAAEAQLIKKLSVMDVVRVLLSLPTLMQCACYFVTFGCELSINGILGAFYIEASGKPPWTQTESGNWAAMYGLLNIVTRPLGGYISDLLYPRAGVEGKKYWMLFCTIPSMRSANLKVLHLKESC